MIVNTLHIGIFGRRNTGKSTLINWLTGQEVSLVSSMPGTTTDPVKKSLEIPGIGAVVLIDTAGIDDLGELGSQRIRRSKEVISKVDCALLLIAGNQFGEYEVQLIAQFKELKVPYLILHNKNDIDKIATITETVIRHHSSAEIIDMHTGDDTYREVVVEALKRIIPDTKQGNNSLIGDLVKPGEVVLMITPIDSEAPEGRLILPQNQAIRDALNHDCITVVLKETELKNFMDKGIKPALAITDSQLFGEVAQLLPEEIPLTSFSILFARQKGDFASFLRGTPHISKLKEGDHVLLLESCTHHSSCDDIGRVKIPRLLQAFTGHVLHFTVVSGLSSLPADIRKYALVIQCGGCMVTRRQLINRLRPFIDAGIPVTNYGMTLAYMNGIFERATAMLSTNEEKGRQQTEQGEQ
ncbi:MAG TPA: [FeFe] hydrogenase H-cluster maturation GTPase HydF [Proteiniphilum sp.]|nr:[FeFe] hydrogenase H-cluster maturation GTPase HydF [Proteiniphilum sp.]HPJ50165.1 [FeFe] hydrogenase H-cluster maturation GTPase HydF [Proteiniphilum sp.]HPR19567.1 [FeFe] hydrogenase H-cluster maturation GTPase HydF [Proteiniphilum sp.]